MGASASRGGITLKIIIPPRLKQTIDGMSKKVLRARTVGSARVGKYLLDSRKARCRETLYHGQQVGPNLYRYGWEDLGGPAEYHFRNVVYNAHRQGPKRIDQATVILDGSKGRHVTLVHGDPNQPLGSQKFWNPRMKKMIRKWNWMKVTREDREQIKKIMKDAYRGK